MSPVTSRITTPLGRPAERQDLIVQEIREQIVVGDLSPGSRLPTRSEIEQKYGAGANTVQRALDRLKQEGFIQSSGRNGTHVSNLPPHLTRYALILPSHPSDEMGWGRFWAALSGEAIALERIQPFTIPIYYGVNGHTDSEDYQQLLRDIHAHRFAGIIFGSHPDLLQHTELLENLAVPRVALTSPYKPTAMAAVYPDRASFLNRAMDHFVERGRHKVAIIVPSGFANRLEMEMAIKNHGLTVHPYWIQRGNISTPESTRELVQLLMNSSQRERPDALLIADDNFVEHSTGGIVQSGARVPEDVEVVAHCNFPWPTPSVLPIRRLGFDARQILLACLENLNQQRRGETVPHYSHIPALFEDEIGNTPQRF